MSTETILLILITTLLSILIIVDIVVGVMAAKLIGETRKVVAKAEGVVDSVESAAEVFKGATGRLAFLKLIQNIIKLVQGGRKK
jgi:hypothetical protein